MNKVAEGRPHIVDMIVNDEIAMVVNTVEEKRSAIHDSYAIRRAALVDQVPTYTTVAGAAPRRSAWAGCGRSRSRRSRRCIVGWGRDAERPRVPRGTRVKIPMTVAGAERSRRSCSA